MAADLIEVEDARSRVLARVEALPTEDVALGDALGRVLAEEAVATEPTPGYDGSAMDGYALLGADTIGATPTSPVELKLVGESRAGHPAERALGPGEAIAISTGAMVPGGADAVLRVEDTERDGDTVSVRATVDPGNDIRRAGEDIEPGRVVLRPGTPLGAVELGVLASLDRPSVRCARRPTVSIVATGDELLQPGEPPRPGGVRSSNGFVLPALARLAGAMIAELAHAGDDGPATREALEAALDCRRRRDQRRRLRRRARPRPARARGARRRAGLLGRRAATGQADLLRPRPERGGGARSSSASRATRSRPASPSCSSPARRCGRCRAPSPGGRGSTARTGRRAGADGAPHAGDPLPARVRPGGLAGHPAPALRARTC